MILFAIPGGVGVKMLSQGLTGTIREYWAAVLAGVAVTLAAHVQLALARQAAGMDDGLAAVRSRMALMIVHMFPSRPVAFLALNAENPMIAFVLIFAPSN